MTEPSTIPAQMYAKAEETAELLKAMAHPARLLVLCQLSKGEQPVRDLQEQSSLAPSAFSQHMGLLKKQQLVTSRKEGLQVYYHLSDTKTKLILAALQDICGMSSTKT